MFDSIIYDFDGTLCDTYPIFTNITLELLHKYGFDDDRERVLKNLKLNVGYALRQYHWEVGMEELQQMLKSRRAELIAEHKPIEGAEEILRYAILKNKKNYIYTHTGGLVYEILDMWGMRDLIHGFIDGDMNFPLKPAPDALNYLIGKYSIEKSRALMVGDRDIDILAGRNAGISGCIFDEGGYYSDFRCEFRISRLSELKQII